MVIEDQLDIEKVETQWRLYPECTYLIRKEVYKFLSDLHARIR